MAGLASRVLLLVNSGRQCLSIWVTCLHFFSPWHLLDFDVSFWGWLEVTAGPVRPEKALEAAPASVATYQWTLAETANTKELNRRLSISLAKKKDRLSFFWRNASSVSPSNKPHCQWKGAAKATWILRIGHMRTCDLSFIVHSFGVTGSPRMNASDSGVKRASRPAHRRVASGIRIGLHHICSHGVLILLILLWDFEEIFLLVDRYLLRACDQPAFSSLISPCPAVVAGSPKQGHASTRRWGSYEALSQLRSAEPATRRWASNEALSQLRVTEPAR